jgi:hypothetical protein
MARREKTIFDRPRWALKNLPLRKWAHHVHLEERMARVLLFSGENLDAVLYQTPYQFVRVQGKIYGAFRLEKFFHWALYDVLTKSFVWVLQPTQWVGFLREQETPDPQGVLVIVKDCDRRDLLDLLEKLKGEVPWLSWEAVKEAKLAGRLGCLSLGASA